MEYGGMEGLLIGANGAKMPQAPVKETRDGEAVTETVGEKDGIKQFLNSQRTQTGNIRGSKTSHHHIPNIPYAAHCHLRPILVMTDLAQQELRQIQSQHHTHAPIIQIVSTVFAPSGYEGD